MIEIRKNKPADLQFVIKSESGKTLLESIPFGDKMVFEKTITILEKGNTPMTLFERKTNIDGKFLFNLKNEEGKVIGSSGLYTSEAGMENGIKNLKNSLQQVKTIKKL
ncbi:MAG: YegP family protein [Maribacter sp.]|jgi:uncharacterized protein YegP (UPF0339 family)